MPKVGPVFCGVNWEVRVWNMILWDLSVFSSGRHIFDAAF
jgi:hypothetical protein